VGATAGGGVAAPVRPVCAGLPGGLAGGGTEARDGGNVSGGVTGRGRGCGVGCGVAGAGDSAAACDSCVGGGVVTVGAGGLTDVGAGAGGVDEIAGASATGETERLSEVDCPRMKSAAATRIARTATTVDTLVSQLVSPFAAGVAVALTDGALAREGMTTV